MKPIYIIFCVFFATLLLVTLYQFRRNAIGLFTFAYLAAIFTGLSVLSLDPEIVTGLLDLIGLKYTASFLIVVLIFLFTGYVFFQIGLNTRLTQESGALFQYVSILHSDLAHPPPVRRNEVLVKMAAYDEAESIGSVIDAVPDGIDVLVIDDASRDDTAAEARRHGAFVIRHMKNMGQGIADITGFLWALPRGYRYVIEMDADGQHDPSSIPEFVKVLDEQPDVDIVVGSRVLGRQSGDVDYLRKVFLPWYTEMINRASGYRLTDALSGYKAYRCSSLANRLQDFLPLLETQYIAAELYIKFSRARLRVAEIPIHIRQRTHGRSRKGTIRYGIAVAWIVVRTILAGAKVK